MSAGIVICVYLVLAVVFICMDLRPFSDMSSEKFDEWWERRHFLLSILTLVYAVVAVILMACMRAAASLDTAKVEPSISLDGQMSEWLDLDPLWEEAGAVGHPSAFPDGIDVQTVYVTNDKHFLHFFLQTSPTIQERFSRRATSGELCEIFIDTDDNADTGCRKVDGYDYGTIDGFEFSVWVSLGLRSSLQAIKPFVDYEVQPCDAGGQFSIHSIVASNSIDIDALVAFGEQGVEMSIPLQSLNINPGCTVRLLLKESVDPFDDSRYSEGKYLVRQ